MDFSNKKVLFIDLDGTLIETVSGDTFPRGIWDMKFKLEVLEAIDRWICSSEKFKRIFVVSNQGGIEKGYVSRIQFTSKALFVRDCLNSLSNHEMFYARVKWCPDAISSEWRKPNTGMLEDAILHDTSGNKKK